MLIALISIQSKSAAQMSINNQSFHQTEFASKGSPMIVGNPVSYSNTKSAKRLETGYKGYLVELLTVSRPLKSHHKLFSLFGNVYYQKIPKKGYVYFIPLGFRSQNAALQYLNQMILPKIPKARLVKY